MAKQRRAARGAVSLYKRGTTLEIRFSFEGKQIRRSTGLPANPTNLKIARALAQRIESDLALGRFSLSNFANYFPRSTPSPTPSPTAESFAQFIATRKSRGTGDYTLNNRYKPLLSHLKRWDQDIATETDAIAFLGHLAQNQSAISLNANLALLKSFGRWLADNGHPNPYQHIPFRQTPRPTTRRPFSQQEILKILNAAQEIHPHYRDFIAVLFYLGLRPSEAIGLRWQDVDFERATLTISTALARNPEGKAERIRKTTKTGSVRVLPLNETMLALFQRRKEAWTGELIFTTLTGRPIDDHTFSQRTWKKILAHANVEHRPPYASRHTALSHLIESGASLVQAAAIAGHANTRMVAQTYGHMIDLPKMPDY